MSNETSTTYGLHQALVTAVRSSSISAVKYLVDVQQCTVTPTIVDEALAINNTELFMFLADKQCTTLDHRLVTRAAEFGSMDIAVYLVEGKGIRPEFQSVMCAAENEHITLADYLGRQRGMSTWNIAKIIAMFSIWNSVAYIRGYY